MTDFFKMLEFQSDKIEARVLHAKPRQRTIGFEIWSAYSVFVKSFADKCNGDQQAREFLRILVAPRSVPALS